MLKTSIKRALAGLGYAVHRLPSPSADPRFALPIDFEYVLAHYLASRNDPRPFFFLQVGANDGVVDDPIHEHVRRDKWRGILIEPQEASYRRLTANYAGIEGLTFVNAAVSEHGEVRRLHVIQDAAGVPIDSLRATASFREDPVRHLHQKLGIPDSQIGSVEVNCVTFGDVMADVPYLDLLQIDVEGYDLEVLKLFAFHEVKPPLVHFEHRHLVAGELDEAFQLLARHGYRMVSAEYDTTAYCR
jgi:FkbM family methyltransferase